MQTIFKYPFALSEMLIIDMPQDSGVLTVQVQNEQPCIWVLVDPDKPKIIRRFKIYGTGQPIVPNMPQHYIGTFQLQGGQLVFHLFEIL